VPRTCTVCTHPDRPAIDAALLAGEPFRHIAARTGTSTGALQRHKDEHLPAALIHAQEAEQVAQADDLFAQVRDLQRRTLRILDDAEQAGDRRTAPAAVREARGNLELLEGVRAGRYACGFAKRSSNTRVIVTATSAALRAGSNADSSRIRRRPIDAIVPATT
jgi:hypothetical protein